MWFLLTTLAYLAPSIFDFYIFDYQFENLAFVSEFVLLSSTFFALGYVLTIGASKQIIKSRQIANLRKDAEAHSVKAVMPVLAILLILVISFLSLNAVEHFSESSLLSSYTVTNANSSYSGLKIKLALAIAVTAAYLMRRSQNRVIMLVILGVVGICCLLLLVRGQRNAAMFLGLPILFILFENKLSLLRLSVFVLFLVFFGNVVDVIRAVGFGWFFGYTELNVPLVQPPSKGEFGQQVKTFGRLLSDPHLVLQEMSYFLGWFKNLFLSNSFQPFSTTVSKAWSSEGFAIGFGLSAFAEAYTNFGVFGFLVFAVWGVFFCMLAEFTFNLARTIFYFIPTILVNFQRIDSPVWIKISVLLVIIYVLLVCIDFVWCRLCARGKGY